MKRYVIKRPAGAGLPDRLARYREELNAEQFAVATSPPGASLVIAGAGSGKTRAITYRVAYLVEHGVAPARIMLATFTNRAAREMLCASSPTTITLRCLTASRSTISA